MKYDIDEFYAIISRLNLPSMDNIKNDDEEEEITDEELESMIDDFIAEFSPYSKEY